MFVLPYATRTRATVPAGFGRAFDRLFEDSLQTHLGSGADTATVRSPALDVHETDSAYIAAFDLPGVGKDQVNVSVEGRRLTLETVDRQTAQSAVAADPGATPAASAEAAATPPTARALYRERSVARYARTVVLPAEVDATRTQARLEDGVLTLTLPKRVPSGATQISIA